MITVRGTSHVAEGDLSTIRDLVTELDADVVAVELDEMRYNALLQGGTERSMRKPFLWLFTVMQEVLGRQAGTMPGSDMLAAVSAAEAADVPVAFVDRDIRQTVKRLKDVPLLEKVKFAGFLLVGWLVWDATEFDLAEVPEDSVVERALLQLKISFPALHRILVEERNDLMAARLAALDQRYDHVLAFVGAGHAPGIRQLLDTDF